MILTAASGSSPAAQPSDCSMGKDARPAAAEGLRQTR